MCAYFSLPLIIVMTEYLCPSAVSNTFPCSYSVFINSNLALTFSILSIPFNIRFVLSLLLQVLLVKLARHAACSMHFIFAYHSSGYVSISLPSVEFDGQLSRNFQCQQVRIAHLLHCVD